jgi:hypothetical protein
VIAAARINDIFVPDWLIDAATVKYIPGEVNRNTTIVTGVFGCRE